MPRYGAPGARYCAASHAAVRRGECWIVHGANGSGKSTLLATLHGEHGVARGGAIWRALHDPARH